MNADRVIVGNLAFFVQEENLMNAAEEGVKRYHRAIGQQPVAGQQFTVLVQRDNKEWRFRVRPKITYEVESVDAAEFRATEREKDRGEVIPLVVIDPGKR